MDRDTVKPRLQAAFAIETLHTAKDFKKDFLSGVRGICRVGQNAVHKAVNRLVIVGHKPVVSLFRAGFELGNWVAIVGPANMPKDAVARLNSEIVKILREPAIREKISAQGFNIVTSTPDELAAFIRSEYEKWGKLVKMSGAKVE